MVFSINVVKKMKIVYFLFYPYTLWNRGGGEIQISNTYNTLRKKGIEVNYLDIWNPQRDFDILHIFGSSHNVTELAIAAKEMGKKVINTSISYSVKPQFLWRLFGVLDKFLQVETKYTYRKMLFDVSEKIIVHSDVESIQLMNNMKIKPEKIIKIPIGVNSIYSHASPDLFVEHYGVKDYILQVGRISARKGQLRTIEALGNLGLDIVFIGDYDPADTLTKPIFLERVKNNPRIHHIGYLKGDNEMLASAYAASLLHILPSTNEFPGIVNMEAGLAGTNVISGWSEVAYEYFGDHIDYCDPLSIDSIREAANRAIHRVRSSKFQEFLLRNYAWEEVGESLVALYRAVLAR